MSLKKLALYSAALNMMANGLDVPISKPRMDPRTYGTNSKRCKSCMYFNDCQRGLNKNPMSLACREYKHKKK